LSLFPDLKLIEFSIITDTVEQGDFIENADSQLVQSQNYACGCFLFIK